MHVYVFCYVLFLPLGVCDYSTSLITIMSSVLHIDNLDQTIGNIGCVVS